MPNILKFCLAFLLFFNHGCSLFVLSDNSYISNEYGCSKKLNEEIKAEELQLERQLFGLDKDQVTLKLGKPISNNIKFGHSYLVNRDCFGKNCEIAFADEAWYYYFKKILSSCGSYEYSIVIYFVDGKVTRVGN